MRKKIEMLMMGVALVSMACNGGGSGQGTRTPTPTPTPGPPPGPATTVAADPSSDTLVKIKVKQVAGVDNLLVGPRGVGACESASTDCITTVTWRWIGNKNDYDQITVTMTGDNADCVTPNAVTIADTGPGNEESVTVDLTSVNCPADDSMGNPITKRAVFYEVRAIDTDGGKSDLVVDPGVIIEN